MSTWLPMAEFDPSKLALVHDKLNDQMIDWEPERHGTDYKAGHRDLGDGVIEWDGLLLDGWKRLISGSWAVLSPFKNKRSKAKKTS
jgi:hypothetical protein